MYYDWAVIVEGSNKKQGLADCQSLFNRAQMIIKEQSFRILEISGDGSRYGRLLKAMQTSCGMQDGIVDRIVLLGSTLRSGNSTYDDVIGTDVLDYPRAIGRYDLIVILDLFEQMDTEKERKLLDLLQHNITRQILIVTLLESGEGFRKYHPLVFLGLDFCYSLTSSDGEPMQIYSVLLHRFYRMPIHLFAVSDTVAAALKEIYNRDAALVPACVDT